MKPTTKLHAGIIQALSSRTSAGQVAGFMRRALLIAILSAVFKLGLLLKDVFPFNADEAIVALMARHILQGELPVFFYGQAYMGSLDAGLTALGFALFGQQVWVIRALQTLLYAATVFSSAYLGKRVFRSERAGLLGALLLAIPAVNLTLYTTVSLGGYGEALLIGNVLLLLALRIWDRPAPRGLSLLWGVLAGLGLWGFGLTLVYSVPAGVLVLFGLRRWQAKHGWQDVALLMLGIIAGASPLVIGALDQGPARLFEELFGSAIAGASQSGLLQSLGAHSLNFLLFGTTAILGMRPPWNVMWLALPLIPFILVFWIVVCGWSVRSTRRSAGVDPGQVLLSAVAALLLAGFLLTPFGADPSGRYFLPVMVVMSLFGGAFLDAGWMRFGRSAALIGAGLILVFHIWGSLQVANNSPPGFTTQFDEVAQVDHTHIDALMQFLRAEGEFQGYSNYWVSYPLAFLSGEELLYVPHLPYHQDFRYTIRDDRYEPYSKRVDAAPQVAYIVTHHPPLEARLRQALRMRNIEWQEQQIGDYLIFYGLSQPVTPNDLDLYRDETDR